MKLYQIQLIVLQFIIVNIALSKGNFGKYDQQYKEELKWVRNKVTPNQAFGKFTTFHDNEAIRKLEKIHVQ